MTDDLETPVAAADEATAPDAPPETPAPARPRPMVERAGMAVIALLMALMFAGVGAASFASGEAFLGVMGVIGALMVLWAGGSTVLRG